MILYLQVVLRRDGSPWPIQGAGVEHLGRTARYPGPCGLQRDRRSVNEAFPRCSGRLGRASTGKDQTYPEAPRPSPQQSGPPCSYLAEADGEREIPIIRKNFRTQKIFQC